MSTPAAHFRSFEPDDLPALQHIRAAAFAPVFESFRNLVGADIAGIAFAGADAEQASLLDRLCEVASRHHVQVATVDGAVAGFVAFSVDADSKLGEIGLNAVHPDHANRGIGTGLIEQALVRMGELGASAVEVSTGADPSHAPARRAYEKAGFGPSIPSITFYRLL